MDENKVLQPQNNDNHSQEKENPENESENEKIRIFDITPDLNISPVREDADSQATIPDYPIKMSEPLSSEGNRPEIKSSITTQKEFGPANPPAKTIANPNHDYVKNSESFVSSPTETATSLKEEVGVILKSEEIAQNHAEVNDPNIKKLRTYESDIAEIMARKKLSATSIAIAESKKREGAEVIRNNPVTPNVPPDVASPTKIEPAPVEMARTIRQTVVEVQRPVAPRKQAEPLRIEIPAKIDKIRIDPQEAKQAVNYSTAQSKHTAKNIILTVISLALIGGGLYAAYDLYQQSPIAPITTKPIPTTSLPTPLIPADRQVALSIDDKNTASIEADIRREISNDQKNNSLKEMVLTASNPSNNETNIGTNDQIKIPADLALKLFNLNVPDILSRSLAPKWMLGVYKDSSGQKSVFVITTNDFFQNAFAGVLQWEKTMAEDLEKYISNASIPKVTGHFNDRIIKNRDVREYVDSENQTLFLYSFISSDKLVIADNESALAEIISRLEKQTFIR